MWEANRATLMAEWAGELLQRGAPPMPNFCQVLFEAAVQPTTDGTWSARALDLHAEVKGNVAALLHYLATHR